MISEAYVAFERLRCLTPVFFLIAPLAFAADFEKCHVRARSVNSNECFIAASNTTILCEGPLKEGQFTCATTSGDPSACTLRTVALRDPPQLWCDVPIPTAVENPTFTVMAPQPKTMRRAPATREVPPNAAALEACRFEYYVFGDSKGKLISDRAKAECLNNDRLKQAGRNEEISKDAYERWRDHRMMNKREIQPYKPPIEMNCTANLMRDGLNCKQSPF